MKNKLISSILLAATIMCSVPVNATELDGLYKNAYDLTAIAENQRTQQSITVAREAVALLPYNAIPSLVNMLSSRLDKPQQELFESFMSVVFDSSYKRRAIGTVSQTELNRGRRLIEDFKAYEPNKKYLNTWSQALDEFQQGLFNNTDKFVNIAVSTKRSEDIQKANACINELKTNEFTNEDAKKFIDYVTNKLKQITAIEVPKNENEVYFMDINLEQAIRQQINKPTGAITKSEALAVTELHLDGKNITNLNGIENFKNLTILHLGMTYANENGNIVPKTNNITDLTPLDSLIKLKALSLANNQISDVSALKNLINMERLTLVQNKISNIDGLKNLTNMKILLLEDNPLTNNCIDIIKNFKNLEWLSINKNLEVGTLKTVIPNCKILQ